MMNLRRNTGQPQEERRIPGINPVETESTSQLPDVVEYFQTGVPSPGTVVSEDEYVSPSSTSDYLPTPEKRLRLTQVESVNLGIGMFVCLTSQVASFIDQMNQNMVCRTPGCNGIFVPIRAISEGLGGAIKMVIACNGCKMRSLTFDSSPLVESSRRTMVGLALQVAFYASGCTHMQYYRTLRQFLGVSAVTCKPFYDMIKLVYPCVLDMIQEMCDESKEDMYKLGSENLGSYHRAVTTGDGTWLTRGFFSQNHTFTLRNYMNNSLLYVVHLCMRGNDSVIDDELFEGTAKAAEGHAAEIAFGLARDDNMHIEVNWQDGDSSSANSLHVYYPDKTKTRVMLCGGHVARAHVNKLKKMAGIKIFTKRYKNKHRVKFPDVETVECCCAGGKHKKRCGCLSDKFIRQARINFFCCLVHSDKDPDSFEKKLCNLGKYHARNIHEWEGGSCNFHSLKICICKTCDDNELTCDGKLYSTKHPLTCPLHALAYEIECDERASHAHDLIHPVLGRGHSNLPEASHNVLVRFRSKNLHLHRLHYITSTNVGLCQSNMTWLTSKKGIQYHWLLDLFHRLKLPVFDGMEKALRKANDERAKKLEKLKTDEFKKNRIALKRKREIEQEVRKQWLQEQETSHAYGDDDELDIETHDDDEGASDLLSQTMFAGPDGASVVTNKKTHLRTSHSEGEDKQVSDTSNAERKSCKCGSTEHLRTNHHDCPFNKCR